MGTCADLLIGPGAAFLIGAVAGIISVWGYVYVQSFLEEKLGIHDTCGVNNLHGMPSIIGAVAGCIAIATESKADYGMQWGESFSDPDRGNSAQALQQFYFLLITLAISMAGGALTGLVVKNMLNLTKATMFMDNQFWEVSNLEMPYFFDHRGEIARGGDQAPAAGSASALEQKIQEFENRVTIMEMRKPAPAAAAAQQFAPPVYIQAPPAAASDSKLENLTQMMSRLIERFDAQEKAAGKKD